MLPCHFLFSANYLYNFRIPGNKIPFLRTCNFHPLMHIYLHGTGLVGIKKNKQLCSTLYLSFVGRSNESTPNALLIENFSHSCVVGNLQ